MINLVNIHHFIQFRFLYLLIWLHLVFAAAGEIFIRGMWDLVL